MNLHWVPANEEPHMKAYAKGTGMVQMCWDPRLLTLLPHAEEQIEMIINYLSNEHESQHRQLKKEEKEVTL